MLFYILLYLCDPYYTLLYYQLYRYLASLYQIIWTFTDPENHGFWKTYLDKEKMLVTSSFFCYYNVFYSSLTKFNFCHLQMLSIWTYQNFCHFFLCVGEWPRGRQAGKKKKVSILEKIYCLIFS